MAGQSQGRDVVQRGLDRQKYSKAAGLCPRAFRDFQRNRPLPPSNGPTAVRRRAADMAASARIRAPRSRPRRAHIGALAAVDLEGRLVRARPLQPGGLDRIVTWRGSSSTCLAGAGQVIGPLALDLDGGKGRRHLGDLADERRQAGADRLVARARRRRSATTAPSASSVERASPKRSGEAIGLRGHPSRRARSWSPRPGRSAGCRSPADRACRRGPAFCASKIALHDVDGLGRGHADRLVQDQPAVDLAPLLRLIVPILRVVVLLEVADDGGVVQQLLDPAGFLEGLVGAEAEGGA